jgi:hypothetical protein
MARSGLRPHCESLRFASHLRLTRLARLLSTDSHQLFTATLQLLFAVAQDPADVGPQAIFRRLGPSGPVLERNIADEKECSRNQQNPHSLQSKANGIPARHSKS